MRGIVSLVFFLLSFAALKAFAALSTLKYSWMHYQIRRGVSTELHDEYSYYVQIAKLYFPIKFRNNKLLVTSKSFDLPVNKVKNIVNCDDKYNISFNDDFTVITIFREFDNISIYLPSGNWNVSCQPGKTTVYVYSGSKLTRTLLCKGYLYVNGSAVAYISDSYVSTYWNGLLTGIGNVTCDKKTLYWLYNRSKYNVTLSRWIEWR